MSNKFKLTMIGAAVAVAMSGTASAAIYTGPTALGANAYLEGPSAINGVTSNTGNGELFISIVARDLTTPSNSVSYVRDLGGMGALTGTALGGLAYDYVNASNNGTLNSLNGVTVTADATLQTFLADASATGKVVSWNMLAIANGPQYDQSQFLPVDVGFLTTSTNPLGPTDGPQFGGFNQASNFTDFYVTPVNVVLEGAISNWDFNANNTTTSNYGQNSYHDNGSWGNSTLFGFQTEGKLNDQIGFWFVGLENGVGGTSRTLVQMGSWTLAANGDLSFATAVPVPATVWLFGSALVGLVGVARRRVSA